jgi:hypothetical protein
MHMAIEKVENDVIGGSSTQSSQQVEPKGYTFGIVSLYFFY